MNKICEGCGIELQSDNALLEGYTIDMNNSLCERCFRLKNYGEYVTTTRSNADYINILKSINKTNGLVLYCVDILFIDKDINEIYDIIKNDTILVINKRDILPRSVNDENIIDYIKNINSNFVDIVVISTKNNYHLDLLYSKIFEHKRGTDVYVAGHTNVGKSSLINAFIKNYSDTNQELTVSLFPSTTLNKINIDINKTLTLIDTPGLVDGFNIINYIDYSQIKRITPHKEIKPKTFQLPRNSSIIIDDIVRIDYLDGDKNSFTFYMSNNLKIKKISMSKPNLHNLAIVNVDTKYNEDIVINGLGFIKVVAPAKVSIYINQNIEVFTRPSLI